MPQLCFHTYYDVCWANSQQRKIKEKQKNRLHRHSSSRDNAAKKNTNMYAVREKTKKKSQKKVVYMYIVYIVALGCQFNLNFIYKLKVQ